MTLSLVTGLVALAGGLGLFLVIQRWLHSELQYLLFYLTRRPALALGIFSLLFFPGVFLHELSHFLMAKLVRVRTGRFSLIPKAMSNGLLRLGYVETAPADALRDTLIGMAPLVTGGVVVALLGIYLLGMAQLFGLLAQGNWGLAWEWAKILPELPDFWLWFYLAFAVSSTMLPSESDRRAWVQVFLPLSVLAILALLAGAGEWMTENVAPGLALVLYSLATVFWVSLLVHLILAIPVSVLRIGIERLGRN